MKMIAANFSKSTYFRLKNDSASSRVNGMDSGLNMGVLLSVKLIALTGNCGQTLTTLRRPNCVEDQIGREVSLSGEL
jgi:hypothetical protein